MSNDDFRGAGPFSQAMTLRGNVIVQKSNPNNNSQIVAIYNDGGRANLTLNVRASYNTFIGNDGDAAFIHVSNADGTQMNAEISNNIISGTDRPALIENISAGTVTGANNWIRTNAVVGTTTSGSLSNSVRSVSPGFHNGAAQDYTLTNNSVCIGAASATVFGLPGREYFFKPATNRRWRICAAARDIGTFESTTTNSPVGPYSPEPRPRFSIAPAGTNVLVSWPLFAQGFQLEQSTPPTLFTWTNAPNPDLINAPDIGVTLSTSLADRWFLLRK